MKNYIQDGDTIELTAPAGGVISGQGVKVGQLFGVVIADALVAEKMQLKMDGVVELTKVTAEAFSEGTLAYWDDTAKKVTIVGTANLLIGAAVKAAAATTATLVQVRLNGSARAAGA